MNRALEVGGVTDPERRHRILNQVVKSAAALGPRFNVHEWMNQVRMANGALSGADDLFIGRDMPILTQFFHCGAVHQCIKSLVTADFADFRNWKCVMRSSAPGYRCRTCENRRRTCEIRPQGGIRTGIDRLRTRIRIQRAGGEEHAHVSAKRLPRRAVAALTATHLERASGNII
jgi:hypothetical protein